MPTTLSSYRRRLRRIALITGSAALSLVTLPAIAADSAESFYKGNQISLIVGSAPGGGYDAYSRLLARHYDQHIPGQPNIVVQNMSGASGVRALNFLYNVAPRDGSAIAVGQRATLVEPIYGSEQVKIDPRKLSWLGGLTTEWSLGVAWHKSGLNSLEDARRREFPVSASGATSDGYIYAAVLNNVLGTKFKIISGYPGNAEEQLAMERGEVAGRIGWAWGSIKSTASDQIEKGLIKPVVLLALSKQPGFTAPLARDYADNEEERQILDFVFAPQVLGRPYFGPRGVPENRLAALRQAFAATVNDPKFLADAEKQKLDTQYVPAEQLADLIDQLYATSPEVIAKARVAREYRGVDGKLKASRVDSGSNQTAKRGEPVQTTAN